MREISRADNSHMESSASTLSNMPVNESYTFSIPYHSQYHKLYTASHVRCISFLYYIPKHLWAREDSNLHGLLHTLLKRARLPGYATCPRYAQVYPAHHYIPNHPKKQNCKQKTALDKDLDGFLVLGPTTLKLRRTSALYFVPFAHERFNCDRPCVPGIFPG